MFVAATVLTALLYLAGEGVFNFYLKKRCDFDFRKQSRKTIIHFGTWALVTAAVLYWLYPTFGVIYGLLVLMHALLLYAGWFEHRLYFYKNHRYAI